MAAAEVSENPFETAVARAFPFLLIGLAASLPLLLVPASADRLVLTTVHLSALVVLGLVLAASVSGLSDGAWFEGRPWSATRKRLVGAVALVVIVTGVVGLVTLASSAALRLQPSLQFLQLLSALDIAWAASAVLIGGRRLWGDRGSVAGGLIVGVLCVLSIWNYLRIVGFEADGGWLLDGGRLLTLVIPADTVAALVAGTVLIMGARERSSQPMSQARPQS